MTKRKSFIHFGLSWIHIGCVESLAEGRFYCVVFLLHLFVLLVKRIRFMAPSTPHQHLLLINSLKMAMNCKWYTYFMVIIVLLRIQLCAVLEFPFILVTLIFGVNFGFSARILFTSEWNAWSRKRIRTIWPRCLRLILCFRRKMLFFIELSKMVHLWLLFFLFNGLYVCVLRAM